MITMLLALIVIILLFGASVILGAFGRILLILGMIGYFIYFKWAGLAYIAVGFCLFFLPAFIHDKIARRNNKLNADADAAANYQKHKNLYACHDDYIEKKPLSDTALIANYKKQKNLYACYDDYIENKPLQDDALQEKYESLKELYDSFSDFVNNNITKNHMVTSNFIECPFCQNHMHISSSHCKSCNKAIHEVYRKSKNQS